LNGGTSRPAGTSEKVSASWAAAFAQLHPGRPAGVFGLDSYYYQMASGLIILLAVSIDSLRIRFRASYNRCLSLRRMVS
jgi:ribose/xylose/arabinose/galactoside ABC-type transport system permease subunit